jgi:hypothetical protein
LPVGFLHSRRDGAVNVHNNAWRAEAHAPEASCGVWTATAVWVGADLTIDQVVSLADRLAGDAGYDAATRVLRTNFELIAANRSTAIEAARSPWVSAAGELC